MKRVRNRALITLCLTLLLVLGMVLFLGRWMFQGRDWVGFFGNSVYYSRGTIYDRNGLLLYDGEAGAYADSKSMRKATMQLVGDSNVATSVRSTQADRLSGYNPVTGTAFGSHDLYLTIDAKLNETAYEALNGHKGVVALYNYKTGEILCLVSAPSFDPLNPPANLDDDRYEGAYLNRFFSSTFVPGSIFKVVTTAAVLEYKKDWESFRYTCPGSVSFGDRSVTCPYQHGADMTLQQAFARSCNCAFAQLALELEGTRLQTMMKRAGLLSSLEISDVTTATGSFVVGAPGSIDLAWSGSGQYQDMVNPGSFLTLMGGIANRGTAVVPTLIKKETVADSKIPSIQFQRKASHKVFSSAICDKLATMMRSNVTEVYGQEQFGSLAVCAKSGTAEVGGGNPPHSWFAGFVDGDSNPLAFVVLVENGGSGAQVAGSVAAKILRQATGG